MGCISSPRVPFSFPFPNKSSMMMIKNKRRISKYLNRLKSRGCKINRILDNSWKFNVYKLYFCSPLYHEFSSCKLPL